jgi:hypothetical protein
VDELRAEWPVLVDTLADRRAVYRALLREQEDRLIAHLALAGSAV